MKFTADLHIHSKYSRATSKNLDLEHIYIAAQLTGVTVVATGDVIHPAWFAELSEKLVPAEQGLYRLRDDIARICDREVPPLCRAKVRFILQTEISNIYKKGARTRKNHNLIYLPDLESAGEFKDRMEAIGNIHSDGRPILGLDAKHLLEIMLEVSSGAFLIPAHVWTPWFSLLGSKSGFDSVEECFEDLAPHIFALETGLSSDPGMNRLVSGIDRMTLVSNSDAHSPGNLGRELNLFDTALSFDGIRNSLEKKDGFLGTMEFYPEEGKYHLDGHRKCRVRCHPEETLKYGNICPVCGKPLTLGVLNRVMALSDRAPGDAAATEDGVFHRVPLVNVLSEVLSVGPQSKKVQRTYQALLGKFGNEMAILNDVGLGELERYGNPLLPEAVKRVREGRLNLSPGYDGEYGKIKLFTGEERNRILGQLSMFHMPGDGDEKCTASDLERGGVENSEPSDAVLESAPPAPPPGEENCHGEAVLSDLNDAQAEAVSHPSGPLLIVAGPGTGKTFTLTRRIGFLVTEKGVPPENILAVTFTNKAAGEMRSRLEQLLPGGTAPPMTATFHSLCLNLLRERPEYRDFSMIDEDDRRSIMDMAIHRFSMSGPEVAFGREEILFAIAHAKQRGLSPREFHTEDASPGRVVARLYGLYESTLKLQRLFDFEGLILTGVKLLENDPPYRRHCRHRFKYIFVDEYQDLNEAQYRLIRALSPPGGNICVIGDPDQAIYGFRGSDYRYFVNFMDDYPEAKIVSLERNYRSTRVILDASNQMMEGHRAIIPGHGERRIRSNLDGPVRHVHVFEMNSEFAEADAVSKTIERLVGGAGYHAVDAGMVDQTGLSRPAAFSDIAVLYRTGDQHRVIKDSLSRYGLPFQVAKGGIGQETYEIRLLLSLFKVVEGMGHYGDLEKVVGAFQPGIGKDTIFGFCHWGLSHGYPLSEAMHEAKRFPIPGLSPRRQERLVDLVKIINGFAGGMEGMSFVEKLEYLLTHVQIEKNIGEESGGSDACRRLLSSIDTGGVTAGDFFSGRALQTETDSVSFDIQKITLMTIHAAKGLEFPIVFLVGCEEDLIPFRRINDDDTDLDEERRLLFVAMTRAKEQLFISWSRKRKKFGQNSTGRISSFLSNISPDLMIRQEPVYGRKKSQVQTQMKLF